MDFFRRSTSTTFLAAALAFAVTAYEPAEAQSRRTISKKADTHVYLMRGLFGVFSLGMDDLAGKLHRDGYRTNIYGWDSWEQVADVIRQNYQSGQNEVVIIGHSLGANAVILVSERLQKNNVPVLLAVTFDATDPHKVPMNVGTFLNFWARDGFGHPVEAQAGYKGELDNFDLSGQSNVDHTSIDALNQFHRLVIAKLDGLTAR
jgi:hypothetical protein